MRKAAPRDKPFTCKKGHVTNGGWVGPSRERCRDCHLETYRRKNKRWRTANCDYVKRYKSNYGRTWGRSIKLARWRRWYRNHREEEVARVMEYQRQMKSIGVIPKRGDFTPTMLAKLRSQIESDQRAR